LNEKIKLKVLACSFEILKLLINFENPYSNPLQRPKAAILTLKMLTGSRLWFFKIIPKAAGDKLILAHFLCSKWDVGTREHRPITEKGILRRVSVSILKNLENHQRILRKYWLKCLDLQINIHLVTLSL
jgi:hypothetical protein